MKYTHLFNLFDQWTWISDESDFTKFKFIVGNSSVKKIEDEKCQFQEKRIQILFWQSKRWRAPSWRFSSWAIYAAVPHPGLGPALQERTSRQLGQGPSDLGPGLQWGVTWRLGRPSSKLSSSLMDHPGRGALALNSFHSFRQWAKNPFLAFSFCSNI